VTIDSEHSVLRQVDLRKKKEEEERGDVEHHGMEGRKDDGCPEDVAVDDQNSSFASRRINSEKRKEAGDPAAPLGKKAPAKSAPPGRTAGE